MKVANIELEGFMDWAGIISSKPIEEEKMSMLAVGFFGLMRKRSASSEGESTPTSDRKRPKRSSLNAEA